jgi:hypothetical protein
MRLSHKIVYILLTLLTATLAYAQQPAPRITRIDAPQLQAGAEITLIGTDFGAVQGILWISNGPAQISLWNDGKIVATIPDDAISGAVWVARKGPPYVWSDGQQSIKLPTPSVSATGITVHDVSVYDNGLLQQMLDADRARLTGMQFLDQGKVAANIGTVQGASMQQSGFALNVGGPPIPGASTLANSGNAVTTQNQGTSTQANSASISLTSTTASGAGTSPSSELAVTSPTSSSTLTGSNQTQITGPSTQTTYTLTQQNPVTPAAAPTSSFTAPSSFSPSASSILNEQVQLNSEVAGLALMMEGPLTDQVYPIRLPDGSVVYIQKHHVTLGVPITITPTDDDKDAVAEIVVTVRPSSPPIPVDRNQLPGDGAPAITAILPQDKTYNTATISSKSVSLGGGIVTGVLTAGVNWLWQKQTYYIVQAQDTVAFQLPSDPLHPENISFGWDLRPVLGNPTVLAGQRTLFVQIAFTALQGDVPEYGRASVTTRWKKLNKKLNIVSPPAFDETTVPRAFPIKDFTPSPNVGGIGDPSDNGDGTVSVRLETGYYTNSTYIKIGNTTLSQGAANAAFLPDKIDFTVPASLIATQKAWLMDRTGKASELVVPVVGPGAKTECLDVMASTATAESATSAVVNATLALRHDDECDAAIPDFATAKISQLHLIAVLGGKVFGYRDAPITFDDQNAKISFHAPLDLIRTSPLLTVERLFWGSALKDTYQLSIFPMPVIDKATVVKKSKDNLEIALIGSNLTQLQAPAGMAFEKDGKTCTDPLPGFEDTNTGRMLCIPGKLLTGLSQAALTSTSGDLLLVALPTPAKPTASGPTLQPQGYLDAGVATNLTVDGTKLDGFDHVEIEKKAVPAELAADKKSILVHLTADMVKSPKIVLVFYFKGSPNVSYTVNVNKKGG